MSWHPEALITVGTGPPAHLEEGLQTAHAGPFVGCRHRAPHPVPHSPQSLRYGARVSEGLPAQRSRRAEDSRGRVTGFPATRVPADGWTPRLPGAQPVRPSVSRPGPPSSPHKLRGRLSPGSSIGSRGQASRSGRPPESPQGPGLCRLQGAACGPLLSGCGPRDTSLSARQLPLLQIRSVSLPGHVYIKCPGRHLSAIGAQK